MIRETIVTTLNTDGSVHIAPMGIREENKRVIIAPFKPSTTLDNVLREGVVVVNLTDDVRIFAGCLTGRYDWPTQPVKTINGQRLKHCLVHMELVVDRVGDDELRPAFHCKVQHEEIHGTFRGFNRAQAAVLEAAILVSRLHMLPPEKIDTELKYLEIAVEKTAGPAEKEAWGWLMDRINEFRRQQGASENIV